MLNIIINKDCLAGLKTMPDNYVDCCVTSPPYYGLRDYGTNEQIGLEETPEQFIDKLVEIFDEVKRVLKPDGTLWLNLGDSYAASGKNRSVEQAQAKSTLQGRKNGECVNQINKIVGDLKPKDLIGIPWMAAFALRKAGWYLRQDIIWHKPNPMPESVTDRCTKSHEYIFLFSKSKQYYFDGDAIKTPIKDESIKRLSQNLDAQKGSDRVPGKSNGAMKAVFKRKDFSNDMGGVGEGFKGHSGYFDASGNLIGDGMANKKSVWTVTTKPFKDAHFATFPEDLIVDCIKAGCPDGGIVLDPFMGAGTTALVAKKLNRNYVGFELNPEYIKIAEKRLFNDIGLFL